MLSSDTSFNEQNIVRSTNSSSIDAILSFEPPVYKENGAGSYIEFRAFDPEQGKLRRKTIKLNHIKGLTIRRRYAKGLLSRIGEQLSNGWNPWIAKDLDNLMTFDKALELYDSHITKMYNEGIYRKETFVGYKSYLKILTQYCDTKDKIFYVYQFDKKYCSKFLDYVFIDRNVGAQTRNNYLLFLKVFSGFLVDKNLLKSRPTDGIHPISKRLITKQRDLIPENLLSFICDYVKTNDPYFLTACYLLYYCFIRPVEMTRLRIRDFNVKESTLTIKAADSKNRKKQTVSIPKTVLLYMIDLGIFSKPLSDYLFSNRLMPGPAPIDTKIFRDHWEKVRKNLKLDKSFKFYSLKDTGITEMLRNKIASISVRDQARHSSLVTTEIYTPDDCPGNKAIIDYKGSF